VIAKIADPTLLLLSIAMIVWLPAKPAGIVTYAMNAPALLATTLAGAVVTSIPPTWMIIGEFAVNPLPMICTVDPTVPEAGLIAIVGATIAKVALAVLPNVSITTTLLFVEVAVSGTANEVATFPPDEVVPADSGIKTPLTVTLKAVPATPKPVPAMLTVEPLTMLAVGDNVIAVVTVKVVVPSLGPSLTSSVYVPAGIAGTKNVAFNMYAFDPVVGTVVVLSVRVDSVPPKVAAAIVERPVIYRVTLVPAIAEVTDVVTTGAPRIVNVATALSTGPLVVVRFT